MYAKNTLDFVKTFIFLNGIHIIFFEINFMYIISNKIKFLLPGHSGNTCQKTGIILQKFSFKTVKWQYN